MIGTRTSFRWQQIQSGRSGPPATLDDYDQWLEAELKKLDAALPVCEQHGLRVVLDLHSPPAARRRRAATWARTTGCSPIPACQRKFVEVWQRMATRYRNAKPIWGYDLVNEPVEDFVEEGCDDWQALAERTAGLSARLTRSGDHRRAGGLGWAGWVE